MELSSPEKQMASYAPTGRKPFYSLKMKRMFAI